MYGGVGGGGGGGVGGGGVWNGWGGRLPDFRPELERKNFNDEPRFSEEKAGFLTNGRLPTLGKGPEASKPQTALERALIDEVL